MSSKNAIVRSVTFLILFLFSEFINAQWNPDAGLVKSYTTNAIIEVSSGSSKSNIVDGDLQSYWESTSPLPSNYISSKGLNFFLNKSKYTLLNNRSEYNRVFDGMPSTKAKIGNARFEVVMKKPEEFYLLSFKFNCLDTVFVTVVCENSKQGFKYPPSDNYNIARFDIYTDSKVLSIVCESTKPYDIFEIAGLNVLPKEEVIFDFRKIEKIGWISSRHYAGEGVKTVKVFASNNKKDWKQIGLLNPNTTSYVSLLISPEISARYLKIIFVLYPRDYQKAKLIEFNAYDKYGFYGKPLPMMIAKKTFAQSFGINAIWGWGYNVYSDEHLPNTGPQLYSSVAKLARNYHSLDWDIKKPTDNAGYEAMLLGNGTKATSWLNWNREYIAWRKNGFSIDACIMFNNQYFNDTLWHNAKTESLEYGINFASHFSKNSSLISMAEVGNEPWEYSKVVYRNILAGMSMGLKLNGDDLLVLPCAIQAYNKSLDPDNYISQYIDISNSNYIDGLNAHVYPYIFNENGKRVAINPENPECEIWSVSNLQRFSLANMSNKPIYVTEFGYDSDGGGDDCIHDICVSEFEQAIFGTRMALILYRLGVKEFYWYYYANVDYHSLMHNRSGLTSSYSKGMKKKLSFYAFELLQRYIGNYYFHDVIMENNKAWVYAFSDDAGNIKRLIAWIPTFDNHNAEHEVIIPLTFNVKEIVPLVNVSNKKRAQYKQMGNSLVLKLTGTPVVIIADN